MSLLMCQQKDGIGILCLILMHEHRIEYPFHTRLIAEDGTTSSGSTGTYNQTIGGVNWLIQMNWVNANSGGCLQHWP